MAVGCHVSAAGGVWNAPKNAKDLNCETFQIFTRPPMGGPAPKIDQEGVEKFKMEMEKYYSSFHTEDAEPLPTSPLVKGRGKVGSPSFSKRGLGGVGFVVHCPYIVNFGSAKKTTFHGSISIVSEELKRANSLGARFVMTHLGSFKDLGQEKGMVQAQKGLEEVLKKYESSIKNKQPSQFLLEIAAGQGEVIGDTFEELAELMEPLKKYKTFGGICFDTQHAWSSGYDITKSEWVKQFEKTIGLKWLRMSHINDSKVDLGGKKDRHEHIGEGKIGEKGIYNFIRNLKLNLPVGKAGIEDLNTLSTRSGSLLSQKGEINNVVFDSFALILETEHDKVKTDIKILKKLREKI